MKLSLNESFIHGVYPCGMINTALSYVSVNGEYLSEGTDFFAQGDDASQFIKEIYQIWLDDDCTQEEAFLKFINITL
jgi:hypothetical protein